MDVHDVIDDVELDDYTVTEAAARVKFRMRHKHGLRARPKSPVGTIQLPKPCTPKVIIIIIIITIIIMISIIIITIVIIIMIRIVIFIFTISVPQDLSLPVVVTLNPKPLNPKPLNP